MEAGIELLFKARRRGNIFCYREEGRYCIFESLLLSEASFKEIDFLPVMGWIFFGQELN